MMAIDIKPENKGKYTARAKASGRSVQAQASHDLAKGSGASKKQRARANFARMAKRHFKPLSRSKRR
jgi:hypothetical protein